MINFALFAPQMTFTQNLGLPQQILFFLFQFQKTDITDENQKQHLIGCFVNQIFLYDDHLVLTFNYKDETKTISLAEVESSDLNIDAVPGNPAVSQETAGFCDFTAANQWVSRWPDTIGLVQI